LKAVDMVSCGHCCGSGKCNVMNAIKSNLARHIHLMVIMLSVAHVAEQER